MDLKTRLQSHPVSVLKKEISKKAKEVNLRGYSAMKKADVITFMLKHSDKFNYIKHSGKGKKVEPPKSGEKFKFKVKDKKPEPEPEPKKQEEKSKDNDEKLIDNEIEKLNETTSQNLAKQPKELFMKPNEVKDEEVKKKMQALYKKLFNKYFSESKKIHNKFDFSGPSRKIAAQRFTFLIRKLRKDKKDEEKKEEPKKEDKPKVKAKNLKSLVAIAQGHKKNGISQEGLKAFNNLVMDFIKTKPPKNEIKVATQLYNYLYRNTFLGTKYMPKNLNKALTELGLRTF